MAKKIVRVKASDTLKAIDWFISVANLNDEDYDLLDEVGLTDVATYVSDFKDKITGKYTIGIINELREGYDYYTEEDVFEALKSVLDPEDYDHYNSYDDRLKAFWISVTQSKSTDSVYDDLKYFLNLGRKVMPYHHYLDILSREEKIKYHEDAKILVFLKEPLNTFVKMVAEKIEEQKTNE